MIKNGCKRPALDEDHDPVAVLGAIEPLADRDLLLVAARQRLELLRRGMRLDVHELHHALGFRLFASARQHACRHHRMLGVHHGEIFAQAPFADQRILHAVIGHQRQAGVAHGERLVDGDGAATELT